MVSDGKNIYSFVPMFTREASSAVITLKTFLSHNANTLHYIKNILQENQNMYQLHLCGLPLLHSNYTVIVNCRIASSKYNIHRVKAHLLNTSNERKHSHLVA